MPSEQHEFRSGLHSDKLPSGNVSPHRPSKVHLTSDVDTENFNANLFRFQISILIYRSMTSGEAKMKINKPYWECPVGAPNALCKTSFILVHQACSPWLNGSAAAFH